MAIDRERERKKGRQRGRGGWDWDRTENHLFGERVLVVRRHAGGDVEDDLHVGCGIVGGRVARAAIPLQAPHEATVRGQVHLRHTQTISIISKTQASPEMPIHLMPQRHSTKH